VNFYDKYGDETSAVGTMGTSAVSFGNVTLENFTFGVVSIASTNPVFGIGFEGDEADPSYSQYTNFLLH
jgi:hypothetical protein